MSTRKRSIMSDESTKEVTFFSELSPSLCCDIQECSRLQVYFIGIIDILVQYGLRKRGEYLYKSRLRGLGQTISVSLQYTLMVQCILSEIF